MKTQRCAWADEQGIPVGKLNDVKDDIKIVEKNRATVYEYYRSGIMELLDYQRNNYTSKGVRSVIYGVKNLFQVGYAIFCQDGFITNGD